MKTSVHELGKDKRGLDWHIMVKDYPAVSDRWLDFLPFIPDRSSEIQVKENSRPTEVAYVHPHPLSKTKAFLVDIRVRKEYEDRGLGSLLIKFVEKWEIEREVIEMLGDISIKDQDHFDKLKHFYNKNGWTFELFDKLKIDLGSTTVGRVHKYLR
jgi:GNAT superfamily N-acetyltransferase